MTKNVKPVMKQSLIETCRRAFLPVMCPIAVLTALPTAAIAVPTTLVSAVHAAVLGSLYSGHCLHTVFGGLN